MFRNTAFVFIFISLLLTSCGNYQKLLKSTDNEAKYEKAMEYYHKGDYYRAEPLFNQLLPVLRGTEKAELIYYHSAYAYFEQKQYLLASYYFKRFSKNFPKSQYAEECAYMSAYSKYLESPKPSLDQSTTYEAINELQLFTNLYPQSTRVEECNMLIDELRKKLEVKAYNAASLYYKMEDYKAAFTSYRNVLKDFPATEFREDILLHIFRAHYYYALGSIASKQAERFDEALNAYESFAVAYPESKSLKSATNLRNAILKEKQNLSSL